MRSLLILMIICCFVVRALSRPSLLDDGTDREAEAEYEGGGDGAEADDSLHGSDDASVDAQESAANDHEEVEGNQQSMEYGRNVEFRHSAFGGHSNTANADNFPEHKSGRNNVMQDEKADNSMMSDKEYESHLEHRRSKYNEHNNANSEGRIQHLTNRNVNKFNTDDDETQVDKRIVGSRTAANEESDFFFENNREQTNIEAARDNNEPVDSSEQSRYFKQYYNTMQPEKRADKHHEDGNLNLNRDRRQSDDSTTKEAVYFTSTLSENSVTEDEEAAIKRHVRKLSGDELDELLNSLSQDKRELLKKIMDSDKDSINKREITKKAGAIDEISLEGEPLDSSKPQFGSSSIDIVSGSPSSTVSTNSIKQTETTSENPDMTATKIPETTSVSVNMNKVELNVDGSSQGLTSGASSADSKNIAGAKTENKREVSRDDLSDIDLDSNLGDSGDISNYQGYPCSRDDDLTQLRYDESQLHHDNGNTYKREVFFGKDTELTDSLKSLEESFPNSNAYDDADPYAGSQMEPLVRVKRKNENLVVKKRAAALLPDAKVAYVPSRAESDDEDSEEGNEFGDEGFYDRTSSLSKNNANDKQIEEESDNNFEAPRLSKSSNKKSQSSDINHSKLSQSMESLGSDTDNVLSGVGVDDNLMYNSRSRGRRSAKENSKVEEQDAEIKLNRPLRSTPLMDNGMKTASENYLSVPKYQDSDAFGPLTGNYEGELSRYKRIRRVKQSPNGSQETTTSES